MKCIENTKIPMYVFSLFILGYCRNMARPYVQCEHLLIISDLCIAGERQEILKIKCILTVTVNYYQNNSVRFIDNKNSPESKNCNVFIADISQLN